MTSISCDKLKKRFYTPKTYNNDSVFVEKITGIISRGSHVLDIGAGSGSKFQYNFKSLVEPYGQIVGADFDLRVQENPLLHKGIILNGSKLPFGNASFDVIFSRYVLEHVGNPKEFLAEIFRTLKPGGSFCFLTPNKWHYVTLASKCTPHSVHCFYNRLRGRDEVDTFPTLYRLNTRRDIRRYLAKAGFQQKELMMLECCPNYLVISVPLFLAGVAYERMLNSSELFAGLRANLLGIYQKPA